MGITRLHGTLQRAGRFKVFPIFHPAAALYDGSKREALENDFATLGAAAAGRRFRGRAGPRPPMARPPQHRQPPRSGMLAEATPGPPAAAAAAPAAAAPAAAQSAQPAAAQPHLL